MAQEALLSLALTSSSAERPSKSRRLTSLPSVAPTILPRLDTTITTSGSGLFQVDFGCNPASMPDPTEESTGALVKTSASGTDADLEILAPGVLVDQYLLQLHRLRRAGFQL